MSVIEHCQGEKPSEDSPGCQECFVVECDVCGECWEVGEDWPGLEDSRHLCAGCEIQKLKAGKSGEEPK